MASQTQSLLTGGFFSSQSSGHHYAISLVLNKNSLPPSIRKWTAGLRDKII